MAFDSERTGFSLGQTIRNNSTALVIGGLIGLFSGGFIGLLLVAFSALPSPTH